MAVSTVSPVNMYMLNKSGPPPPPPVVYTLSQSNMNFPDFFTGLTTTFTYLHTANTRITFSSGMSGTAWRDVANGYELLCSSYGTWRGTDEEYIHDLFDSTGGSTFWGVNTGANGGQTFSM
jgi:hypothetical protein